MNCQIKIMHGMVSEEINANSREDYKLQNKNFIDI